MPYDILLGISIGLSVMLFWIGRRLAAEPEPAGNQMERYLDIDSDRPTLIQNESAPTQLSFMERVIVPAWRGLLDRLGGLAPQRNVDVMAARLETAGRPYGLNVLNFLGLKFIAAPLFAILGFGLGAFLPRGSAPIGVMMASLLAGIGFYVPNVWLEVAIMERKRHIIRVLPDALDMLVVCVEAGQNFDQALKRVESDWRNPVTEEFSRILAEIGLGRTRREALISASERVQLPDMSNMIMAIVQAEQLGVPIGNVLRSQAGQLRLLRRQRAETLAREASIKLLFPLVFLIFPSMLTTLIGPAVPLLLTTLGYTIR